MIFMMIRNNLSLIKKTIMKKKMSTIKKIIINKSPINNLMRKMKMQVLIDMIININILRIIRIIINSINNSNFQERRFIMMNDND